MEAISIGTRSGLDATVQIPGSKSCTARALVMAGLTKGRTILTEPANCDDTDYMVAGLLAFDVSVAREGARSMTIDSSGLRPPRAPLFLGNSGTAMRFLTAACATIDGHALLDGSHRMRERPIGDLLHALEEWGVEATGEQGCPPVRVRSEGRFGGQTRIRGNASSQYLTGLLLVAPRATQPVRIIVEGELVSKPYIDLTLAMMRERGVEASHEDYQTFVVPSGQEYTPGAYAIEADASGASYFLAAAAIVGGRVRVENLPPDSHQGDVHFVDVLRRMGCQINKGDSWIEVVRTGELHGIDVDLNAMPDMAQTLAVTALFAEGPTAIRNVANLRIKECDRISATVTELRKLGAEVEEFEDGMTIRPQPLHGATIDTYDDHRMAMSFAMAGLRVPGLIINAPHCVSKTFPDFFERFQALR